MRRALAPLALALAALLALPLAAGGAMAPPAQVEIGRVQLVQAPRGAALLVPVSYPIELSGRSVALALTVAANQGGAGITRSIRVRLSAGELRVPDRRRSFRFVHAIPIGSVLAAAVRAGGTANVAVKGPVRIGGELVRELSSSDAGLRTVTPVADHRACGSIPRLRARPGRRIAVPLPICGAATRWRIAVQPERGRALIRAGKLIYRSSKSFRGGTASIRLAGAPPRGVRGVGQPTFAIAPVQITVGPAKPPVVRALGDSVTAGFGYFEDGSPMALKQLLSCKPGETTYDDACSSNSKVRSNKVAKVEYAADYGLANNVSWTAQWANAHGVTDFKNLAVSGSEPSDWTAGGQFFATTKQLESEDPDYVLLTMGANPLLSDMLFGVDNMGCAIYSRFFGEYRTCLEEAFAEIKLQANLKALYRHLVQNTTATIVVMRYHLSVPSTALLYSAAQIAEMGNLMNREIGAVAAEVSPQRIVVVTPPHFNVGLDIEPAYPSSYSCSSFGFQVDGPSVQAEVSQDEMETFHYLSFCPGPKPPGPEWVINGDTGIHPSAAGYAQMAARVPPPG